MIILIIYTFYNTFLQKKEMINKYTETYFEISCDQDIQPTLDGSMIIVPNHYNNFFVFN